MNEFTFVHNIHDRERAWYAINHPVGKVGKYEMNEGGSKLKAFSQKRTGSKAKCFKLMPDGS